MAEAPAVGEGSAYEVTKRLICDELRTARRAKGWSQTQLGEAIGASRFMVNRLEAGTTDLRAEVAERIEQALGTAGLVALVAKREALAESDEWRSDRDVVMQRLLRTPRLQRVRIILVDDLDVHELIADNPAVGDAHIELIVPTAARERQLFGGSLPISGHLEYQIRRLSEVADGQLAGGVGSVEAFESDKVLSPTVLVRSAAGTECAYWPVLPSGPLVDGRNIQAVASHDPRVTAKVEAHIDAVRTGTSRIRKNEALAVVDPTPRPQGENRPVILTRFVSVGNEPDEGMGGDEAFAVALVLIHTICPRRDLGLRRRILVYRRPHERADRRRWSLPSHTVEEIDVRRTRRIQENRAFEDLARSSTAPLDATLEHAPYLQKTQGAIPIEVFKEAASRGLFADFGVEVHVDRLVNVVLPPDLQRISKVSGDDSRHTVVVPRIIPRLFTLDLTAVPDAPSTYELSEIKKRADIEEWGYEDLAEHDDLNDFLADAKASGFLGEVCQTLGVAAR